LDFEDVDVLVDRIRTLDSRMYFPEQEATHAW